MVLLFHNGKVFLTVIHVTNIPRTQELFQELACPILRRSSIMTLK